MGAVTMLWSSGRASAMLWLLAVPWALLLPDQASAQLAYVGVNWGRAFSQVPLPDTQSFTILKNKGIRKIKLFNHNVNVLNAINSTIGSGAQVTLGIPNGELSSCATNYSFVLELLTAHQPYKSIIKQVAVSNEPDTQWSAAALPTVLLPAIANVRKALSALGMSAKVVVPFAAGIVSNSYPPSAGVFGSSWLPTLNPLLQTLNATGSSFMINLYPYFAWRYNQAQIPLDYALSKPTSAPVVDGALTYHSLLDAMYDATLAALAKAGYSNMVLVIGESGWPTAGDQGANADTACYYNNRMIKKASSVSTGTPRMPGKRVPLYVFEALDELKKPGGSVEPYWGAMTEAGVEKYTIDWPAAVTGIPCAGQPTKSPTKAPSATTTTTTTTTTTSAPTRAPTKAPSKAPTAPPPPATTTLAPTKAPTATTTGSTLPLPSLPAPVAGSRVLVFQNAGNVTVFMGMIGTRTSNGQQLASINPQATGFELAPGASKVLTLPDDLSGRTWVRTGCRWMTSKTGCSTPNQGTPMSQLQPCPTGCTACSLVCDTGTCGADNGLASPLLCMSGGGEPPATLVEWTLGGSRGTDFYDLSNVDGFNTGISVAPIPGRFTKVGNTGTGAAFDCGAPACHIPADPKTWCPPELQVKSATGSGGVYCTSVCKAVTKPSAWPTIDNTTTYNTEAGSMTPRAYLQHMSTAVDWRHPNHVSAGRQGMMKDLLCCICGPGATTGCEQRNPDGSWMQNPTSPCTYGCSPYSRYPASWWNRKAVALKPDGTSGEMVTDESQLDVYPDWPLSTVGSHYAKIYYNYCPTTYSWQFGDGTSTYQCKQADYLITVY